MGWMCFRLFFFILVFFFTNAFANELGSPCTNDRQCKVGNSVCLSGVCTCKHYHAPSGTTECLESKLLGRECLVSEQCSLRVANSTCREGHCHCSQGFLRFRKHTCLGPAKPGDVCYGDEHCQLWSRNSHCKFLIPKLFGKCICNNEENCEANETEKPYVTDSPTVNEKNKSTSTTESNNDGEVLGQVDQKTSEESEKPQNSPFVDPFQHQKEHLQVQADFDKDAPELVGITVLSTLAEGDVTESDSSATEETSESSENPEAVTDGFKYRVEASETNSEFQANSNDSAAVSLGHFCRSNSECRKRDQHSRCLNGICDCPWKLNGTNSCTSQNRGCGPETFQCRESGTCISWFFVCDGRNDCLDGSDEECHGLKCPKTSFRCGDSQTCVSLAVICDGVRNCPGGEDELFCSPDERNSTQGCPDHTFECTDGQCLPKFEFCNAIPKCKDGSDESPLLCSSQPVNAKAGKKKRRRTCPFECGNGRCRSTAIVCSGRDGCGDNSDESQCSVCRCAAPSEEH